MNKKLKTPADYGQLYCRIDKLEREEIEVRIEKLLQIAIKNRKEDELLPRRNDIFIKALKRGLTQLEREGNK